MCLPLINSMVTKGRKRERERDLANISNIYFIVTCTRMTVKSRGARVPPSTLIHSTCVRTYTCVEMNLYFYQTRGGGGRESVRRRRVLVGRAEIRLISYSGNLSTISHKTVQPCLHPSRRPSPPYPPLCNHQPVVRVRPRVFRAASARGRRAAR